MKTTNLVQKLDGHVDACRLTGDGDESLVGVGGSSGLSRLHNSDLRRKTKSAECVEQVDGRKEGADLGRRGGPDLVDLGSGLADD
jgi:hypothetical protein